MKEAFIATLLALARTEMNGGGKDDDDIDEFPFWKEIQEQVKVVRDEMRTKQEALRSAMFAPFDLILNVNQYYSQPTQ